jgi:hypothetical protein
MLAFFFLSHNPPPLPFFAYLPAATSARSYSKFGPGEKDRGGEGREKKGGKQINKCKNTKRWRNGEMSGKDVTV